MSYQPQQGSEFIFYGVWYDAFDLLDFIIKIREEDYTVRSNRRAWLSNLNSLKLPNFRRNLPTSSDTYYISEFEGDWLDKITDLRSFFSQRGTNKGNSTLKGKNSQDDDTDLHSDDILKFLETTKKIIKELRSLDNLFTLEELQTKFGYIPPSDKKPEGEPKKE